MKEFRCWGDDSKVTLLVDGAGVRLNRETGAVYVFLRDKLDAKRARTREVAGGQVVLEFDARGELAGVEVLAGIRINPPRRKKGEDVP